MTFLEAFRLAAFGVPASYEAGNGPSGSPSFEGFDVGSERIQGAFEDGSGLGVGQDVFGDEHIHERSSDEATSKSRTVNSISHDVTLSASELLSQMLRGTSSI